MSRGRPLLAVMKGAGAHYWQQCFMSETEKEASKKRHERDGVRVKEKSGDHLKAV